MIAASGLEKHILKQVWEIAGEEDWRVGVAGVCSRNVLSRRH